MVHCDSERFGGEDAEEEEKVVSRQETCSS